MDSTLVSARIPRAKKERAAGILEEIGATASELINSAFDYVIAEKRLPSVETAAASKGDFEEFVKATTLEIAWPDDFDGDYKALMAKMRLEEYEALA